MLKKFNEKIGGDLKSLAFLNQNGNIKKFKSGETVYLKDLGFFLILNGNARVFYLNENGKEITIFFLNKEDCCILSTTCILNSIADELWVEFKEDMEVFLLKNKSYEFLCADYPKIMQFNLNLMSKRFSKALETINDVAFSTLKLRVMKFLENQAKNNLIKISHEEIANNIGSAREAVTRILKELKKEGKIDLKRGEIFLK